MSKKVEAIMVAAETQLSKEERAVLIVRLFASLDKTKTKPTTQEKKHHD